MGIFWENLVRPAMFAFDAERAHEMGIEAMRAGLTRLVSPPSLDSEASLKNTRFGLKFENPIGLAAGFDKNGVVVDQLASLGFGFVEVGTVTYHPQPGNPKPRLFRLPEDKALINRLGFNNDGADAVAERLTKIEGRCVVGVNIGRNKDVDNEYAIENYLNCFEAVYSVADYITVNVSSPNTPNLRELQRADHLEDLITALQVRNAALGVLNNGSSVLSTGFSRSAGGERPPDGGTQNEGGGTQNESGGTHTLKPLLVKIAPDLNEAEIESIVDLCLRNRVAGIIATNTTISREGLTTPDVASIGAGGLSGVPLRRRATEVISTIYGHSQGKLPIIGVGGIFTAEDAFEKIAAGASLLQAYTGFVYGGPSFAVDINRELATMIKARGFAHIDKAVGSAIRG